MTAKLCVVTGATGLLGSHVVEQLIARGQRVRALVRSTSDTTFLRTRSVELMVGDLANPASLPAVLDGADVVYHCAARVGDWGPWRLFQQGILATTTNLLDACRQVGVGRFLHVSSINVYGHPQLRQGQWLTEDEPLGQRLWLWDHYCRAKILTEQQVRAYPAAWTIVRPSWIYGPRDRNSFPRAIDAVRRGRVSIVGRGDNRLNIVYAADVADGVVRAAEHPGAAGQAYHLASEGVVSQQEFLDALTTALQLPPIKRHVPFALAFAGGFLSELIGRAIGLRRPPVITRYAVALVGRSTRFRIDKARDQLGWQPRTHPLDGLRETLSCISTEDDQMIHFADRLTAAVRTRGNPLCVGLDPRWDSLPASIRQRHGSDSLAAAAAAIEEFCSRVLDLVAPLVPVVKPQAAFFEACGPDGLAAMQRLLRKARALGLLTILDGKRNDIASTASAYADAAFAGTEIAGRVCPVWQADALTINPYLGRDAVEPFIASARQSGGGVFVLVRTSNKGAGLFQDLTLQQGQPLYQHVGAIVGEWTRENPGECGLGDVGAVVGATYPEELALLRKQMPEVIFLVPGFGAQGGTAADVQAAFRTDGSGAVVNSSRGILFPFAPDARDWEAAVLQATRQTIAQLTW